MTLRVVPEGLAAACAGVEALTARLAAAHAVAAPLITAVAPPPVDPVSLQSAAEFSVRGGLHAALAAQGAEELGRAGSAWGSRVPAMPAVTQRLRRRMSSSATDDDRADLDCRTARGAFDIVEQRSWTRAAVEDSVG